MSAEKKVFRYIYDANNQLHVDNINNNVWPPPDEYTDPVSGVTTIGWWVGVGALSAQTATSPDFPDQNYNEPELQAGEVKAGLEPVPVKFGDSFENNYNPEHGKGVYLAGVVGFSVQHNGYETDSEGNLINAIAIPGGVLMKHQNINGQWISSHGQLWSVIEGYNVYITLQETFYDQFPGMDVVGLWWSPTTHTMPPAEIYENENVILPLDTGQEESTETEWMFSMPGQDVIVWIIVGPEGTTQPGTETEVTITVEVYDNASPSTPAYSTQFNGTSGESQTFNADHYLIQDADPATENQFDRWEGWHTGNEKIFTKTLPSTDETLKLYYDEVLT